MEPLMNPEEVAEVLGRPPRTLRQWRYMGLGPKYVKVGTTVRYRREDVEAWIESQVRDPTAGPKAIRLPEKGTP